MRTRHLIAGGAAVLAATAVATLLTFAVGHAEPHRQAAEPPRLGDLALAPATGLDTSAPVTDTSQGCPDTTNAYNMFVYGPGAWADGFVATTTSDAGFSTAQPFAISFGLSFKDIAVDHQTTVVPGKYTVVANCVDSFELVPKAVFTRDIWFTDATHYTSTDPGGGGPTTTTTTTTTTTSGPTTTTDTSTPTETPTDTDTTRSDPLGDDDGGDLGGDLGGDGGDLGGDDGTGGGTGAGASGAGGNLPTTGVPVGIGLLLGVGLLSLGVLLYRAQRRPAALTPVEWPED